MSRKKSEFLSAGCKMIEVWQALINAVLDKGGTDDDVRRIFTDPKLANDLADRIMAKPVVTKPLTEWQTLFAACRQTHVSPDFSETNYPLEPVEFDEADWEACEHKFSEGVNGAEAFEKLQNLGYRLCGPRRAMEFIVEHLDLQLDHPLVVPARYRLQRCGGHWCVPVFCGRGGDERDLGLGGLDVGFVSYYGWLVLRRKRIMAKPASEWQTLLGACQQHKVHPEFNERNFPLEPVAPDEMEWEVYELELKESIRGEATFEKLQKLGYRLCGPRRAMEFIAAAPDHQLHHSLIVTARWQCPLHDWHAPIFYYGVVNERNLGIIGLASLDFPATSCRLLVLRKRG